MAHRVTIQEAIRLTGKSRRTLYRDMDAGHLSYHIGPRNRRYFDIAELCRVYGELQGAEGEAIAEPDPSPAPGQDVSHALVDALQALSRQVEVLTQQNQYIIDRMRGLEEQVDQVKRLPAPTYPSTARALGEQIAEQGEEHDDPNGLHAIVRAMREKEDQERSGGLH